MHPNLNQEKQGVEKLSTTLAITIFISANQPMRKASK
jgi:hypothetical protein